MNPWLLGAMLSGGAIAVDKLLFSDDESESDTSEFNDSDSSDSPIIGELNIVQGESETDDPTVEAVSDSEREQIEDGSESAEDTDTDTDEQGNQDEPTGEDSDTERSDSNSEDDDNG